MSNARKKSTFAALTAAALLAVSATTMLGMQGPGDGKDPGSADPKAVRDRLLMRIEDSKRLQQRLQAEVDRIDKGEAVSPAANERANMRPEAKGDRPDRKDGSDKMRTPPEPLTPEERAQLLEFVKEQMPRAAEHLRLTEEKEPEVTNRVLMRFAPKIREVLNLKTTDPKLFSLKVNEMRAGFDVLSGARDLGEAVHAKKPEAETAQIESSIKEAIGRRFDAQLAVQRLELESLGERVNTLKAEIDRKSSNRDASVNEEAARLIERARKFDPSVDRHHGRKGEDGRSEPSRPPSDSKTGGK